MLYTEQDIEDIQVGNGSKRGQLLYILFTELNKCFFRHSLE